MKTFARKVLALTLTATLAAPLGATALAAEFADMPAKDYWSYEALQSAVDNGLLQGADDKLNPKGLLMRSEMATVVNRAFGATQTAALDAYTDVPQTAWYYLEMAKAVKMKTFQGSGTTLNPENPISRQEAFAVLARALQISAADLTVLDQFTDSALISESLKAEFAAMVAAGFVKGDQGKANPTGTITREEFAQVMHNAIKTYVKTTDVITEFADGSVMVNVPNATLKNLTIKGDLIVGDGVGAGDLTLEGVVVEGRLLIRGGGVDSIKATKGCSFRDIFVNKPSDGGVRFVADDSCKVPSMSIAGGTDNVIVDAKVDSLSVSGTATIEIRGTVLKLDIKLSAEGVKLSVSKTGTVKELTSAGPKAEVSGEGKVEKATVTGNDTKVDTKGTVVTVGKDTTGTTSGDKNLSGGGTTTTPGTGGSTGGGGGGGGGTTTPTNYKNQIDAIMNDNGKWIVDAMNKDGAAVEVAFVASSAGGTLTVKYDLTKVPTVGDAVKLVENLLETELSQISKLVTSAEGMVKTIAVGDKTLTVEGMTLSQVKSFVSTIFVGDKWDANTPTSELPATRDVVVTDESNNVFTYTVVNANAKAAS